MAFPSSPSNGQIHTQAGTTYIYDSAKTAWKVASSTNITNRVSVNITATSGQTVFASGSTLNGDYDVHLNGVKLTVGTDYTSSGNNVVLSVGASAGDIVTIDSYNIIAITDAITQTVGDSRYIQSSTADVTYLTPSTANSSYVNASGDNMTGALTMKNGNVVYLENPAGGRLGSVGTDITGTFLKSWNGSGEPLTLEAPTGYISFRTGSVERMRIDQATGYITKQYQPAFHAWGISSQSSGLVQIYPNTNFNIGSHYSTSTGRFTAPITGTYLFGWTSIGNNSDTVYRYYFRVNGSNVSNGDLHFRGDAGASGSDYVTNGMYTIPWRLNAGDYVSIYYVSDNGSGQHGDSSSDYPRFWGYLLG